MEKKQQVLLSVMGWTHEDDDPSDSVRLLTTGTMTGGKDAWRIDYTETQPDNESSDVTLLMDKGVVTMQRSGTFATSMVFEQGRRFEGSYRTPYGDLAMGVYPTHVKYQVEDGPVGEVDLTYQLDLQGQFAAMHELRIRFCPSGRQ
ncbi:MAG: DUF1934 domain-containing protein [Clostridia bacterium]|nr:DUF1934 domain-containing protein [Clostridia bacterium]